MPSRAFLGRLAARAKRQGGVVDLAFRYNPLVRARVLRAMDAFAAADLAGRRALAEALTARILRHAARTAYGQALDPRVGLAGWPVLGKEAVRAAPERFATRGLLCIPAATGGTMGVPIRLVRSPGSVAAEQAFLDRLIAHRGLSWAGARIAALRADAVKDPRDAAPPYAVETHGGRRLTLSSPHLTAATLPWYLERLERFRPDILWVYPSMAANLLRLLPEAGRFRAPVVLASSERLDPCVRARMERDWGAEVVDHYGHAERLCLASGDHAERHLFHPAYGRVELIPSAEDEIADGGRHVRIVATGYWNPAMPLVRFDTGDRAIVPAGATDAELEAIALGLAPFRGIAGRTDEFVVAPGGMRICGLNHWPRDVPNLLRLQVVQDAPDLVTLRVLAQPGFGPSDQAALEANARAKLPPGMRLRVEVTARLETTPLGKTPFVIRRAGTGDLLPAL